jgi:hypothetical protein
MKHLLSAILLLMPLVAIGVTAQWPVSGTTPTQREDNTSLGLSEIDGFNMYCGTVIGAYTDKTFFPGATLPTTKWLVTGLAVGTHHCVFKTLDIDGRESAESAHITLINEGKAVPKPPLIAPNQVITVITSLP